MGTHSATIIRKVVAVFVSSVALWVALFSIVQAESIPRFDARIDVSGDSSMVVTETIVYDFGNQNRHGIYRNIYNSHPQAATSWYKNRHTNITLLSVLRNGRPEPYNEQPFEGLSVRIGDPNRTITGVHTYEIRYRVDGALAEYKDGVELYWNVTGDEWRVSMNQVKVEVYAIEGATLQPVQACYVGYIGSNQSCSTVGRGVFIQDELSPGEQVTIAQRFSVPGPIVTYEKLNSTILALLFSVLWFIGLAIWIYRWRTKHKVAMSIIPQYEPLPDFRPMFTGILIDGRLDAKDISAGLVYLAQQGFIHIKEVKRPVFQMFTDTDYEITLLRPLNEVETEFQKTLLELLFRDTPLTLANMLSVLTKPQTLAEDGNAPNLVGTTVSLDELKKNQPRLRRNVQKIHKLSKATKADLVERGYFEQRFSFNTPEFKSLRQVGLWMLGIGAIIFLLAKISPVALFALVISSLLFFIGAYERRTQKGYEVKAYLEGFKDFLSVTEKERYKFHNAPSKNPEQFMEYLPYAIAFGVEKQWAEVFADIQLYQPEWYQSDIPTNTFNPVTFSSALSLFSNSFIRSSGTSGSSGGGSAGGGSGGGGGGSW